MIIFTWSNANLVWFIERNYGIIKESSLILYCHIDFNEFWAWFWVREIFTGEEWVHCLFLLPLVLLHICFLFLKIKFQNGAHLKKRAIFDLLFTFFSHQGKVTKIPSAHISLTYILVVCSPYWLFCLTNFRKNTNLSGLVSLWCDSWCWFLFTPF